MKTIDDYTIYCTEAQTRKALELGAQLQTIDNEYDERRHNFICSNSNLYKIPTAEQMIGFLRSKGMRFYFNDITALWQVVYNSKIIGQGCSFNKELLAIDAALDYLMNNKK